LWVRKAKKGEKKNYFTVTPRATDSMGVRGLGWWSPTEGGWLSAESKFRKKPRWGGEQQDNFREPIPRRDLITARVTGGSSHEVQHVGDFAQPRGSRLTDKGTNRGKAAGKKRPLFQRKKAPPAKKKWGTWGEDPKSKSGGWEERRDINHKAS